MIHVYPTVIEKTATAWNKEREERYVLAILPERRRRTPAMVMQLDEPT